MIRNPVYKRLVRRGGTLTREASTRLLITVTVITSILALIALIADPTMHTPLRTIPYLILGVSAAGGLLTPPLVLLLTAILVGRDIVHEDFAMLRLTPVKPNLILRGYFDAANKRMEILWALSRSLLPPIAIAIAHPLIAVWAASFSSVIADLGTFLPSIVLTLIFAITALATACFSIYAFWYTALRLGVWIGVRWGSSAPMVAGGIFILTVALMIVSIAAFGPLIALCCFTPFIIPFGALLIGNAAMRWALKAIERLMETA